MARLRLLLVLTLSLTALTACGDTDTAKLGGSGELCFSDGDCRSELICDRSICRDPSEATDNNGLLNNGVANNGILNNGVANNGFVNNGVVNNGVVQDRYEGCKQLCDYVSACFGGGVDDTCADDCWSQLMDVSDEEFADITDCFLSATCRELENGEVEQCLPNGFNNGEPPPDPGDRYGFCSDLYDYFVDICPEDLADQAISFCYDAADRLSDDQFWSVQECLNESDCNVFIDCALSRW